MGCFREDEGTASRPIIDPAVIVANLSSSSIEVFTQHYHEKFRRFLYVLIEVARRILGWENVKNFMGKAH